VGTSAIVTWCSPGPPDHDPAGHHDQRLCGELVPGEPAVEKHDQYVDSTQDSDQLERVDERGAPR